MIEYQKIFVERDRLFIKKKKGIYFMIFLPNHVNFFLARNKNLLHDIAYFLHGKYDLISSSSTIFGTSCLESKRIIKATSNIKDNEQVVDRLRRYMYVPIKYKTRSTHFCNSSFEK